MRLAADACTALRIALAPLFAWAVLSAHTEASLWPFVVFGVAAGSDFADGRLARAAGTASVRGRLFDHGADAIFLFPALFALAAVERVSLLLPCAATLAFALYLLDGWRRAAGRDAIVLVPSQLGAVGGVLNYAIAGGAAVALALGPTRLDAALALAALLAALANVASAVERGSRVVRTLGAATTLTSRIGRP